MSPCYAPIHESFRKSRRAIAWSIDHVPDLSDDSASMNTAVTRTAGYSTLLAVKAGLFMLRWYRLNQKSGISDNREGASSGAFFQEACLHRLGRPS